MGSKHGAKFDQRNPRHSRGDILHLFISCVLYSSVRPSSRLVNQAKRGRYGDDFQEYAKAEVSSRRVLSPSYVTFNIFTHFRILVDQTYLRCYLS